MLRDMVTPNLFADLAKIGTHQGDGPEAASFHGKQSSGKSSHFAIGKRLGMAHIILPQVIILRFDRQSPPSTVVEVQGDAPVPIRRINVNEQFGLRLAASNPKSASAKSAG
ncbi:MAG: hypothetical protein ABIT69_00115 [Sphingomicrobium sp.]